MRKTILVFLSFFVELCFGQISAQGRDWDMSGYLPIVREGVKWVNERVIIDHGTKTSYYYTYEIKGTQLPHPNYFEELPACHYYTGTQIDPDNDSIISLLRDGGSWVTCYNNWAYDKMCRENRNLIRRGVLTGIGDGEILYEISYLDQQEQVDMYINRQRDPIFLTRDNLIVADPVDIEGYSCRRLAYINEKGDTLAYIIDGIGFDSRDMGDLLTPFTQTLDPWANWEEYQEYCGLSHVIKDGKIIYKGMRYREGAFDGVDEVVADKSPRPQDENYYDLMGQPVGKDVPTAPGIYIHNYQKIIVNH